MSQSLIEQNGKYYKEVNVVIIETKEKTSSTIMLGVMPNVSALTKDVLDDIHDWMVFGRPQHLYFLSDEEIKEGDWLCYGHRITQASSKLINAQLNGVADRIEWKKIIATTDCLMLSNEDGIPNCYELPQPSPEFIKAFIEAYNSGKPIVKCLVEYNVMNKGYIEAKDYPYQECEILKLKDNQIIIKKIEEKIYSESEVIELLHKRMRFTLGKDYNESTTNDWIKQNLK